MNEVVLKIHVSAATGRPATGVRERSRSLNNITGCVRVCNSNETDATEWMDGWMAAVPETVAAASLLRPPSDPGPPKETPGLSSFSRLLPLSSLFNNVERRSHFSLILSPVVGNDTLEKRGECSRSSANSVGSLVAPRRLRRRRTPCRHFQILVASLYILSVSLSHDSAGPPALLRSCAVTSMKTGKTAVYLSEVTLDFEHPVDSPSPLGEGAGKRNNTRRRERGTFC